MFELPEILVVAGMALIFSAAMVWMGVSAFNKEAKERGTAEKGYTVGSVIVASSSLYGFRLDFL